MLRRTLRMFIKLKGAPKYPELRSLTRFPLSVLHFTMPFPFGVSIGDFIVCIDLIKTVVESLQEAHGSASKYRGLVASLESLETALVRVRDVKIHDPVLKQELQHVATKCRNSLSAFLAKVAKYEPSLKLGGSASCIKDSSTLR